MNSIARVYAQVLGGVLLCIGILGFIPTLTPKGLLLGLFSVNPLHNLVHVLTGLVGLSAGLLLPDTSVRLYTITMTIVYGLVAVIGFAQVSFFGFLMLNPPDTLLHVAIFVLSLLVTLSAFGEQGFLRQRAGIVANLNLQGSAAPLTGPRLTGQPVGIAPANNATQFAEFQANMQERLRHLERDTRNLALLREQQQTLLSEVERLRHDLDQMRAQFQATAWGHSQPSQQQLSPQPSPQQRPPQQSMPRVNRPSSVNAQSETLPWEGQQWPRL